MMACANKDLPAPDSPTSVSRSPASKLKLQASSKARP